MDDFSKEILFCVYENSIYSENLFSLTEFSEKFLLGEIRDRKEISKFKFLKSMHVLENLDLLTKNSNHHLTTLSSWKITEKAAKKFEKISRRKIFKEKEFIQTFFN